MSIKLIIVIIAIILIFALLVYFNVIPLGSLSSGFDEVGPNLPGIAGSD